MAKWAEVYLFCRGAEERAQSRKRKRKRGGQRKTKRRTLRVWSRNSVLKGGARVRQTMTFVVCEVGTANETRARVVTRSRWSAPCDVERRRCGKWAVSG